MVKTRGIVWTLAFLQHLYLYDGCVYRGLQNREPWGPELDGVTWWGTASYRGKNVRGKVQHDTQVLSLETAPSGLPKWYNWSTSNRSKEKKQLPSKGKQSLSHPLLFVWNVWNQRVTCVRILSSKRTQMEEKKSVAAAQLLSRAWPFVTAQAAARQAPLSSTVSGSLLKLVSFDSVMPSNHLRLCCPLRLLPSIFPSIRVFSNEVF